MLTALDADGGAGALDAARSVLRCERVGLVVNHAQEWSDPLTRGIGGFLRELYGVLGLPSGGVELIAFWGDYPVTPFGAHQDFEDAVFFHLGPGPKTMHLWDPEVFVELAGSSAETHDFERYLDHACSFELAPGDVLFHPRNWFHVAVQRGTSASVSAGLCDASTRSLLADVAQRAAAADPGERIPPIDIGPDPVGEAPWRAPLAAWTPALRAAVDDLFLRRLSNAGFICRDATSLPAAPVTASSVVQLRQPFSLVAAPTEGQRLAVFGRHRRVDVIADPGVLQLVDLLNGGEPLAVHELPPRLGPRWPTQTVAALLAAFTTTGAIEVVA